MLVGEPLFKSSVSQGEELHRAGTESPRVSGKEIIYFKVSEIQPGLYFFRIRTLNAGFFTKRGRIGDPIIACSGEKLELWWKGIFPRFELIYFKDATDKEGRTIGRCEFLSGCNESFFIAPDADEDGTPDLFQMIEWRTRDTCEQSSSIPVKEKTHIFYPPADLLFVCEKEKCKIESSSR